jgi:hypothetical protein
VDLARRRIGAGLIRIAAHFASSSRCQQFGDECLGYTPDPEPATVLISPARRHRFADGKRRTAIARRRHPVAADVFATRRILD